MVSMTVYVCVCLYVSDTDIQVMLKDFNTLHPNLQFPAEVKRDNTLNSLDISIHKTPKNIKNFHSQKTYIHGHHHPLHV